MIGCKCPSAATEGEQVFSTLKRMNCWEVVFARNATKERTPSNMRRVACQRNTLGRKSIRLMMLALFPVARMTNKPCRSAYACTDASVFR